MKKNAEQRTDEIVEPSNGSNFSQLEIDIPVISREEKEKLDASQQKVAKRSGKRKKIGNIVMFLVNVCVVVGILLYQILREEFWSLSDLDINIGFQSHISFAKIATAHALFWASKQTFAAVIMTP